MLIVTSLLVASSVLALLLYARLNAVAYFVVAIPMGLAFMACTLKLGGLTIRLKPRPQLQTAYALVVTAITLVPLIVYVLIAAFPSTFLAVEVLLVAQFVCLVHNSLTQNVLIDVLRPFSSNAPLCSQLRNDRKLMWIGTASSPVFLVLCFPLPLAYLTWLGLTAFVSVRNTASVRRELQLISRASALAMAECRLPSRNDGPP